MPNPISKEIFDKGHTYESYRKMTDELLAQGRTTGVNQSESLVAYTKVNVHRMNRLDQTIKINDDLMKEIKELKRKFSWLVITEPWCGDAAQNIPVFAKIAALSDNIELKFILRDENPEVMNQYLTNGGKAIPILVCFDSETMEELWKWGPRPVVAQKLARELVTNPGVTKEEKNKKIIIWYTEDKTSSIQNEFLELIKSRNK